jgi:hypothetical protein
METKNRNIWTLVAVILVVLCCCAVATVAVAARWFKGWSYDSGQAGSLRNERIERDFNVGEAPSHR